MTDLPRIKLKDLIESIPDGLSPLERVIIAHDGTVHTLLSLLTNAPVYLNVLSQTEEHGMISRNINFTVHGTVIMEAWTTILVNDNPNNFIEAIRRQKAGIGQIINFMDLNSRREMMSMNVTDTTLHRKYHITGDCTMMIRKAFDREFLKGVIKS